MKEQTLDRGPPNSYKESQKRECCETMIHLLKLLCKNERNKPYFQIKNKIHV